MSGRGTLVEMLAQRLLGGATRRSERAPVLREALLEQTARPSASEAFPDFGEPSASARGMIGVNPPPVNRLAFLLSAGRDERNYDIGRYLDTRKAGGLTPTGARRTGRYSGAYASAPERQIEETLPTEPAPVLDAGGGRGGQPIGQWEPGLPQNTRIVHSGADPNGGLTYETTSPEVWRIQSSWLPEGERGQGNGIAAYESVIQSARENGVPYVESSWARSGDSTNIYNALKRRGYDVSEIASEEPGQTRFRISTRLPSRAPDGNSSGETLYHGTGADILRRIGGRGGGSSGGGAPWHDAGDFMRLDQSGDVEIPTGQEIMRMRDAGRFARESVRPSDIIGTQSRVETRGLNRYPNANHDPVELYRTIEGDLYIIDGHHRVAAAASRGDKTIAAHIFNEADVNAPQPPNAGGGSALQRALRERMQRE